MGFRCAKCGKYVSDDEQYWYDNYGKYCSEFCMNQAYNERLYAEEQEEARHENAMIEAQARQEAAIAEAEARQEAAMREAEAAQRVADTQYEAARQARLAQQDKLEHEKEMAAREQARREHVAMLAKSIEEDGVYYSRDKTAIVEVTKAVSRLVVPDYVKDISSNACKDCVDLKSVTLPEGLETIGEGAFSGCKSLYSINFPKSLRKIGEEAFINSGIEEVEFPEGIKVKEIPSRAFAGCSELKNVDSILRMVESLGDAAFAYSGLTEVTIPANIKKFAYYEMAERPRSNVDVMREWIHAHNGFVGDFYNIRHGVFHMCKNLKKVVIEEGTTKLGKFLFSSCPVNDITLPASFGDVSGLKLFANTSSDTLTVRGTIKEYPAALLRGFAIIIATDTIDTIGASAFEDRTGLKSFTIPANVTSIGNEAFSGCSSLESITIPDGVKSIGSKAFWGCTSLKSITIPDGVTEILPDTFNGCKNLQSVSYKGTLKNIGERAFKDCTALTKVDDLLAHVDGEGLDGGAFQNTGITELTIPANVKTGSYDEEIDGEKYTRGAFACCENLTKVTIAEGKVALGTALFVGCKKLMSITLPSSIKRIKWGALKDCSSLTSVEIPSGVELIEASAFSGCEKLPSVKIPSNISAIEKSTFWGCKNLTSVTIPNSVTTIGEFAFQRCESLASVTFPSSVKKIGKYAFSYCDSLTSVSVPNSVKEIGEDAFRECNSLVSVSVPRGIKELDAFYGCKRLKRLPIGGGRTKKNSKYEPHTPVEKLLYKLWGTKKAKKRAIIILACLALVFLIKYAMGGEERFAKKAQKNFDSWYTSAADIIVGQTFTYYMVDSSSGEISVKTQVPFAKDGFADGDELYTVDTAARTVDSETRDGDKYRYAYFPDGSAYYYVNDDGSAGMAYTKEGAQFNAAQATEVIGKTFSGKWSDSFTASITFGADGKATVKFSDGDTGTGSYIASDEDNIVLYNHRDKGVWHKFVYSDDSDDVTFKRYYAEKLRNGRFDTSFSTDTHDDWKKK